MLGLKKIMFDCVTDCDGNTKLGGQTDWSVRAVWYLMYGNWRGDGSHRNGSRSRSVGDVGDGFFESSLRPNWGDLEDRRGDNW